MSLFSKTYDEWGQKLANKSDFYFTSLQYNNSPIKSTTIGE